MLQAKRWNVAPADGARAGELASRLKASPILAQLLLNRGLTQPDECFDFLRPSLKHLHEPWLIPGLKAAAQRVARAVRDRRKIVIYGDYDVDGITATAILWHAIRALGGICDYYIPHRLEEGYGLNAEAIGQICRDGAELIISVDCGITAIEPAAVARRHGVDLIVTDHHDWHERTVAPPESLPESVVSAEAVVAGRDAAGIDCAPVGSASPIASVAPLERRPVLPDCFAIVHPRLPGTEPAYPNPHLCGAGVAFKLAWGVGLEMNNAPRVSDEFRAVLLEATALAALGTIADVVPLVGENRSLAHFGLGGLKASKLTGIRALIESANLTGQNLDSFHVGFLLAPRLNACGRMGHARLAVELLTSADAKKATEIASFLEQQNRARQGVERKILEQALAQIETHRFAEDGQRAIVLGAEEWHPGVVGIVASRIVERFHRPVVMIGLNNGHGQGSARSISGFHLARALEACGEHLEAFGGHEMAAGLKLQTARLDDFRAAFCQYAQRLLTDELLRPEMKLDCAATLDQVTAPLVNDLSRLGPFGHANPRPVLICRDVTISTDPRRVGKTGSHLLLNVRQGKLTMKCIAFGFGDRIDELKRGTTLDLAVAPTLNEYNGRANVELEVKDLQFTGTR